MAEESLADIFKKTLKVYKDAIPTAKQRLEAGEAVKKVADTFRHDMQIYTAEVERKRVELAKGLNELMGGNDDGDDD